MVQPFSMWVITQELQRNNTELRKYSVPGKCFWSYCFQQRLLGPHATYRNVHFQSDSEIPVALCTNVTPNVAGTRISLWTWFVKVKVIPQQAEVAKGLRPRIFLTFGTTRVVGRQPYAPAVFTPREIPGSHFQRLNRPGSVGGSHGKNPQWHHRESIPGPSD